MSAASAQAAAQWSKFWETTIIQEVFSKVFSQTRTTYYLRKSFGFVLGATVATNVVIKQ